MTLTLSLGTKLKLLFKSPVIPKKERAMPALLEKEIHTNTHGGKINIIGRAICSLHLSQEDRRDFSLLALQLDVTIDTRANTKVQLKKQIVLVY